MTANRPTLKTISELSGLAVATVSRALGDAPDISTKTKIKVRSIANQIGYVPNRAGVRLRTGRTHVISVLISTETDMMNARLISSISSGLRETNYHLNIMHCFPHDDPMDPVRYVVETGSADCLIINAIEVNDPRVDYLTNRNFPFVMHGRRYTKEPNAYFDYDNEKYGELAVHSLVKKNRKKVLVILPPKEQFYSQLIFKGANMAANNSSIEIIVAENITSSDTINKISEYVSDTIKSNDSIDAAIVPTINSAMATIAGFESNNKVIGQDFDIVSKDSIDFLKLFRKEIIVIEENVKKAGNFLAKAAINAAKTQNTPALQFLELPDDSHIKM